jgi:tetratricopeptide (TPR) repeat protein
VPLDYATTQNNRAVLLRDLASLPGEDRGGRLRQALAAYDEALALRRDVPLAYAQTQNNRAVLLSDLASLPGEDRGGRLRQALAAYDEALALRRDVPLAYAQTQNNRAVLLSDLASLPGEDRGGRLRQALAAYDEALAKLRDVPLDYAATQNNRAVLLSDLASLPGEDRGGRLRQALAAYDEALALRRDVPLDYAQTQNNRAVLLSALASLPGEDRGGRLREALRCAAEAVFLFDQLQHVQYLEVGRRVLRDIRSECGDDFLALWAAAGLGDPPDWLDDAPDEEIPALLQTFVQVQDAEQMIAFWQAVPSAMEEPFMAAVEALIAQTEQAGDGETVKALRSRLEGFRAIRAGAARSITAGQPLLALLQEYQEALQAADAEQPQVTPWQAVVALGERLLAMQAGAENLLDWDSVRQQVASDYNTLGNAHDRAGDVPAALAAFQRAAALQPDFAMFRRNVASTLIDLGRLNEARAAIDQARALEPDAPRLEQLEAQLAAAQESMELGA